MAKANHTSAEENNSPSSLRRLPTKKLSIQAVLEVVLVQPAGHPPDSKASLLTPRTQVAISCALCGATWPRSMAIAAKH
jgi:hypothetical protein